MNNAGKETLEVGIVKYAGNAWLIELKGRIADPYVPLLQRKVERLYNKTPRRIIIDVTGASFLDSHGLGMIVYFHTLMQKNGRQLIIVNNNIDRSSYLTNLFETTNLDKVLTIVREL